MNYRSRSDINPADTNREPKNWLDDLEEDETKEFESWSDDIPNRVKINNVMVSPQTVPDRFRRPIYVVEIDGKAFYFIVVTGEKREIKMLEEDSVDEVSNHDEFYRPIWNGDVVDVVYFNYKWRRPKVVERDNLGRPIYRIEQDSDKGESVYFITDSTGEFTRFIKISDGTYQNLVETHSTGQGIFVFEA